MKLDASQIRNVEAQLGVDALEDDHPVTPQLVEAFGEHTFFLDAGGLNIVESMPPPDVEIESTSAKVVKLASWSDDKTSLATHEPEVLPIDVDLSRDGPSTSNPDDSSA